MSPVRWGLLSTASIGALVVRASRPSSGARFTAVASRDGARARAFADAHDLPLSFASYDELLASEEVDAVYVALPSSQHTEWTGKALAAGKHVLCEKPFATAPEDAAACFDLAEAAGLVCAEGLMWRFAPQTHLARRLLADGAVGELRVVRAALSNSVPTGDIRRSRALGGGALLDLGSYCASAARLYAGSPQRVHAEMVFADDDPTEVDVGMVATLRMPEGVLAHVDIGTGMPRRDELELVGSAGTLVVPDPWICRSPYLELRRADGAVERVPVDADDPEGSRRPSGEDDVYRVELDVVSAAIAGGPPVPFGRADAVEQAGVVAALRTSGETGTPVSAPWSAPRPRSGEGAG